MIASNSPQSAVVTQLLRQAETLPPEALQQLITGILTLNTRRKQESLPVEELILLKKINIGFPAKKWNRFTDLDEKRKQQALTPEEHRELLRLVRLLEKYDSQRLLWVAQLAALRQIQPAQLLKQLGLYAAQVHG